MKLKKAFEAFYQDITIDVETEQLKDKRDILQKDIENKLPSELQKHAITLLKSEIRIIDQGSYKLKTTIKNPYGSIDRDVAVMIPLDIEEHNDPRTLKEYLTNALAHTNRTITIKEPCVCVSYIENGEEWLHIDLPLYAQVGDKYYLARGKKTSESYEWQIADPDGLNDWLVTEIGKYDQLRRIIRYIKKWKLEKYHGSTLDHEIPPSIGLTLLTIDNFVSCTSSEGDDDLLSLQKTLKGILSDFTITKDAYGSITKAEITRLLPVEPHLDVFDKMKSSSDQYAITFYKRLTTASDKITDACNLESEHDAGVLVQDVLGEEFTPPPKDSTTAAAKFSKEYSFG